MHTVHSQRVTLKVRLSIFGFTRGTTWNGIIDVHVLRGIPSFHLLLRRLVLSKPYLLGTMLRAVCTRETGAMQASCGLLAISTWTDIRLNFEPELHHSSDAHPSKYMALWDSSEHGALSPTPHRPVVRYPQSAFEASPSSPQKPHIKHEFLNCLEAQTISSSVCGENPCHRFLETKTQHCPRFQRH